MHIVDEGARDVFISNYKLKNIWSQPFPMSMSIMEWSRKQIGGKAQHLGPQSEGQLLRMRHYNVQHNGGNY